MTKIIHIFTKHVICTDPIKDMARRPKPKTKAELERERHNGEIIEKLKLRKGTGLRNSPKPCGRTHDTSNV